MENTHYLNCNAPICQSDPNINFKNEVNWYPGEGVCTKGPYQKFQKVQIGINKCFKKGKFKNIDNPFTANYLETHSV